MPNLIETLGNKKSRSSLSNDEKLKIMKMIRSNLLINFKI